MSHSTHGEPAHMGKNRYRLLLIMLALSFAAMYVLMYAMVDVFTNVYNSLNQFYMAGLMTAAMIVIEMGVMRGMYHNKRLNVLITACGVVALTVFWLAIREQTVIGDRQFLRSMIPHHAGAILMCKEAALSDAEIQRLCAEIIVGQQSEIDQMKAKLGEQSK